MLAYREKCLCMSFLSELLRRKRAGKGHGGREKGNSLNAPGVSGCGDSASMELNVKNI